MVTSTQEAAVGDKRGPAKNVSATPAHKKQKTTHASTPAATPPSHATANSPPVITDSPAPERRAVRLPAKINDNRPLPILPEPQPAALPNDEFQSIAASSVLATSLEKSRARWICDGILKRYWVKPEKGTGKNAKPLPPNNPDPKQMKMRGECRIRIEPHLFVANLYVVEKNVVPPKNKQPALSQAGPHQRHQQAIQQFQPRAPQPALQQYAGNQKPCPPMQNAGRGPSTPQPGPSRAQTATSGALPGLSSGAKSGPDPVISMLATRASSDPELKALMKEVATGNANPEQLKVFQKHIDELTTIIEQQKSTVEGVSLTAHQQADAIQYDRPAEVRPQPIPQPTGPRPQQNMPQRVQVPAVLQHSATTHGQQQPWAAPVTLPVATNLPVVLEFTGTGATEDRFLFPEYSILEALSPQHLLVSFILTRKACDAVDGTGLEPDKEYWQPITMMIEVAYGREELLNCIRRWVKPAEEVRANMQESMERCQRMPESHLALRLPLKGTMITDSEDVSKEATPIVEEKSKSKAGPRRKASTASTPKAVEAERAQKAASSVSNDAKLAATPQPADAETRSGAGPASTNDTDTASPAAVEGERSRRGVRKSVRISEG